MGGLVNTFGSILGTNSNSGLNYQAQGANVQRPQTPEELAAAQQQSNQALGQQQNFVSALNAQNGIGNQSNIFNQQQGLNADLNNLNGTQNNANAMSLQSGLAGQLAGQNAVQNQSNVFNQQQQLANQLGQLSRGQGPNPAMAQLANTTGQNIQQQAALMASQRGAGANAGLLARQAAQVGANAQQQAVGQGAAMSAQQQIAAMQALQGQQGLMANTSANQIGQQQSANQAIANQSAQQIAMQQAGINSGATQAANQIAQQANALNSFNQQAQNNTGQIMGGLGAQNQAAVNMQSNLNNANSSIANQAAQQQGKFWGGAMNGAGSAAMMAQGGMVQHYDDGGPITDSSLGPQSSFGKRMAQFAQGFNDANTTQANGQKPDSLEQGGNTMGKALVQGISGLFSPDEAAGAGGGSAPLASTGLANVSMAAMYKGGKVNAMVSPGEVYIPPQKVNAAAKTNNPIMAGRQIPGKAKVKGDSLKNDTVPAKLEEGGIVLPRTVVNSKNPGKAASDFVHAILSKNKLRK